MSHDIMTVMEHLTFPIVIEQDNDGFYVFCPAFQGCYSQGETYEEALKNIQDAISLHLEEYRVEHREIPSQKSISLSTVEVVIP